MPTDRPDARELVVTVRELLDAMIPTASGYDAFQLRVAANLLAIVDRELESGGDLRAREVEGMRRLLGDDLPVEALDDAFVDWIRTGEIGDRRDELFAFLRSTAESRLRISNPKHLRTP